MPTKFEMDNLYEEIIDNLANLYDAKEAPEIMQFLNILSTQIFDFACEKLRKGEEENV